MHKNKQSTLTYKKNFYVDFFLCMFVLNCGLTLTLFASLKMHLKCLLGSGHLRPKNHEKHIYNVLFKM